MDVSWQLCRCSAPPVGVTLHRRADQEGEHAIVSFESVGAQLYPVDSPHSIHSWGVTPGTRITSPVVYHPLADRYFCIKDDYTLCGWAHGESISAASTRVFKTPLKSLHVSSQIAELVVVFTNATVLLCNTKAGLESVHTSPTPKKCTVLLSEVCTHKSRAFLVVVRQLNIKATTKLVLNIHQLDKGPGRAHAEESLVGAHVLPTKEGSMPTSIGVSVASRALAVLWSDGTVNLSAFPSGLPPWESFGMAPKLAFSRTFSDLTHRSICFLAPHFLAVLGTHAATGAAVCRILESVFGTEQEIVHLPVDATTTLTKAPASTPAKKARFKKGAVAEVSEVSRSLMTLSEDGSFCVCVLPSAVCVLRVASLLPSAVPSLASVVGRLSHNSVSSSMPPVRATLPLLTTLAAATEKEGEEEEDSEAGTASTTRSRFADAMAAHDHSEQAVLSQLVPRPASGQAPLSASKFAAVFQDYVARFRTTSTPSGRKRKREQKDLDTKAVLSHHFVTTVAQHCLEHCLWVPLRFLIESNLLSARAVPGFMEQIAKHGESELVRAALLHMHDLSEETLVYAACLALDALGGEDAEEAGEGEARLELEEEEATALLDLCVSSARSDAFLHDALRGLPAPSLERLLEYLLDWTKHYWGASEEGAREGSVGHRVPSLAQVLDWTSLTLDANFTGILVRRSERAHLLLQALQHLSNAHLGLCDKLGSVTGLLATLHAHRTTNKTIEPTRLMPEYSVEILAL